jgi:hypothetical protein
LCVPERKERVWTNEWEAKRNTTLAGKTKKEVDSTEEGEINGRSGDAATDTTRSKKAGKTGCEAVTLRPTWQGEQQTHLVAAVTSSDWDIPTSMWI